VKDPDAKPVITVMKLDGKTLVAYSGNATECAMLKMVNVLSSKYSQKSALLKSTTPNKCRADF